MSRPTHPPCPSAARALRRLSAVQRRRLHLWLGERQLTLAAARVRLAAEFGVKVPERTLARFCIPRAPSHRCIRDSVTRSRLRRAVSDAQARLLDALYFETRHLPEAVALLARLRPALAQTVEDLA